MTNLKVILPQDEAKSYQDRVVEYVCEFESKHAVFGKIISWRGALDAEYFSVVFLGGNLIVSVVEREMLLGHIHKTYAATEAFIKSQEKDSAFVYDTSLSLKEAENMTFDDANVSIKLAILSTSRYR